MYPQGLTFLPVAVQAHQSDAVKSTVSSANASPSNPMSKSAPREPVAAHRPEPTPPSYEAAIDELESLVARIESGQMPLDQLLQSYQQGANLLKFCRARLEAVEQQVTVLEQGRSLSAKAVV